MEPTQELIDDIYRERVLRARRMSVEDRMLAGAELSEHVLRLMADGIRNQFPEADEEQVQAILADRFRRLRQLRETR